VSGWKDKSLRRHFTSPVAWMSKVLIGQSKSAAALAEFEDIFIYKVPRTVELIGPVITSMTAM
jgi:hypothetical protein